MDIREYYLPNGIRLVHHETGGDVSHCGIFINAGTRDETEEEHGIAHFIEHVIFKGTEKRTVYQVLNRLENVGADLNAFTTKEETVIHASFLNRHYGRTLELISDICFHSVFPQKELEKEKDVVIDEIKSYKDTPSEQIFDDFEDLVFNHHPLGRNILGTPKNVKRFRTEDVRKFILRQYNTDRIVICSVGNIPFRKLLQHVLRYFSGVPVNISGEGRKEFKGYRPVQQSLKKRTFQTHCILGAPGYSLKDDRRFILAFLNNILGGPMMNSRLSISLRERNGLCYQVESNYVPFSDTGIFTVYFGTDGGMLPKALALVEKELQKIRSTRISPGQLETARTQLIGQLSIAGESKLNLMLTMGRSFLVSDNYLSLEDVSEKIRKVTADQLMEVANEIFPEERMSRLIFHSGKL
jgi:predicted Zn-dependent peptidase